MKILVTIIATLVFLDFAKTQNSPEIVPIPGGLSGTAHTTRYWDCCVPACSYPANASVVTHGVEYCLADGETRVADGDYSKQPECQHPGGGAFTCNGNQPWIVNDTLAYGFTAASFKGGVETNDCCKCLLIQFQGALEGKSLLAQVTNTGSDLTQNHFDIQIPGGGVGIFTLGCMGQWGTPEDGWGERYGGITSEEECSELPPVLQEGCRFRWTFLEGVSNPNATFYQVRCPSDLVAITGCSNTSDL
ncbi:unnamed protein product [Ceutorhynchus assimilis]|uniref:Cellulase n=1 Tax=Ceutorhynchus assimilis TaxID=467358 RepID=A0A9N9MGN6_9CUCU|nr:unnamed protein product [Ceutorhynchus assimilis]